MTKTLISMVAVSKCDKAKYLLVPSSAIQENENSQNKVSVHTVNSYSVLSDIVL